MVEGCIQESRKTWTRTRDIKHIEFMRTDGLGSDSQCMQNRNGERTSPNEWKKFDDRDDTMTVSAMKDKRLEEQRTKQNRTERNVSAKQRTEKACKDQPMKANEEVNNNGTAEGGKKEDGWS